MDERTEAAPTALAALAAMGEAMARGAAEVMPAWAEVGKAMVDGYARWAESITPERMLTGAVGEYNRRMEEINRR